MSIADRVLTLDDFLSAPYGSRAVEKSGVFWTKDANGRWCGRGGGMMCDDDMAVYASPCGTRIFPPEDPERRNVK